MLMTRGILNGWEGERTGKGRGERHRGRERWRERGTGGGKGLSPTTGPKSSDKISAAQKLLKDIKTS